VCADDCGANSAKRTTTRSRLASSTSNLALFKNEDGAALKSDKFLIGRSHHHPYFSAIANESRFYSGARYSATFRRDFTFNAATPGINKIKTRGGRGVREFVARARRPVRGYIARFK